MNDKVKEFWDKQAIEFGASDLATAPDHYYRELEINSIIDHLPKKGKVLDVGCGNGYSTRIFKQARPECKFTGVDYSPEMISAASISDYSNISYAIWDVRELSRLDKKANCIISERCLINLKDWEEQKQALLEMKKCLAPGGRIILVENFINGLDRLNELREKFGLHPITVRWHNRYLQEDEFMDFADKHFYVAFKKNIGNLYYIISRVVYAALCKESGLEIAYDHPINKIASMLPCLGHYEYSPNYLYVLEVPRK